RAVGMWESPVLCEISKSLWEPFCGFHRDGISIALFIQSPMLGSQFRTGGYQAPRDRPIVVPGASSRVDVSIRPRPRTWRGDGLSGCGERSEHTRALAFRDPALPG